MVRNPAVLLLIAIAFVVGVVVALAVACSGGSDDDGEPVVSSPTPGATAVVSAAAPTPSVEIRDLDLESVDSVAALVASTGGQFVQSGVLYADLTDDGFEEAVVPISSGGTRGDIAFVVLTPVGDGVEDLLIVTPTESAVSVSIVGGKLEAYEPRPGPDDPFCCPSELQTTIYAWDGEALVIESQTTQPAGEPQ